jgi:hypothetical protein
MVLKENEDTEKYHLVRQKKWAGYSWLAQTAIQLTKIFQIHQAWCVWKDRDLPLNYLPVFLCSINQFHPSVFGMITEHSTPSPKEDNFRSWMQSKGPQS